MKLCRVASLRLHVNILNTWFYVGFIKNKISPEYYSCRKVQEQTRTLECVLYSVTGFKSTRI